MAWPQNTPWQEAACREPECALLWECSQCVRENGATVTATKKGQYHADEAVRKLEVARRWKLRQERAIT